MPRVLPKPAVFEPFGDLWVAELRRAAALGALFRFSLDALLNRALACLLPAALERFFIASTRAQGQDIISGRSGTGHGLGSGTNAKNRRAIAVGNSPGELVAYADCA